MPKPISFQKLKSQFSNSQAMTASSWLMFEIGATNFIRLVGNLVLTRLLVPEYFGIMAILYATTGLFQMISDIGLVPSVINTTRDKDKSFLETIWTIQVLRSLIIAVFAVASAYPVAIFYDQPILTPLMIVAAVTVLGQGFTSIAPVVEQKYLRHKTRILTFISAQLTSTVIMAFIAYFTESIWSLMIGYSATIFLNVLFSYMFFDNHHSRFRLERAAVDEVIRFGRWIFLSTVFGYLCTRADVLVLGRAISIEALGVYSIAAIFSTMIVKIPNQFAPKLLHPMFKKIYDETGNFSRVYERRFQFNLIICGCGVFFAIFGNFLIILLYDERYYEAGWMLQILALGKLGIYLTASLKPLLMTLKNSFGLMLYQIFFAIVLFLCMATGYFFGQTQGVIIGVAVTPLISHFMMIVIAERRAFRCAKQDLSLLIGCALMIVCGWWLTDAPALAVVSTAFR